MPEIAQRGYATPEVLVSTDWVAQHLNEPNVRIIESNEDPLLYPSGHIPGAVQVDWAADLNDPLRRDYLNREGFEALMSRIGATPETTVVIYGDRNNWYACYTFWLFKLYRHADARIMNGGRQKWTDEQRQLTRDLPTHPTTTYTAKEADNRIRAFRDDVMAMVNRGLPSLVDVRSPQEYSGEILHMLGYPQEGAQRAGHVKGARSIPWSKAANTASPSNNSPLSACSSPSRAAARSCSSSISSSQCCFFNRCTASHIASWQDW